MTAMQISFGFAVPIAKPSAEDRAETKARELICCACGLSWAEGCSQPHWMTVDVSLVAMRDCSRCGRTVCHLCYARGADDRGFHGTLCPDCFALPPPTRLDARRHPLASTHGICYAASVLREISWRYEAPAGQTCQISPAEVWFWSQQWSKLPEKESDRRFRICAYGHKPEKGDEAWCPSWILQSATGRILKEIAQ